MIFRVFKHQLNNQGVITKQRICMGKLFVTSYSHEFVDNSGRTTDAINYIPQPMIRLEKI